jgi:HAD superfamily hydrolase (TIGR01450 family)
MDEHPNPMHTIPSTTIDELIERYDALLFDAYGVLVHRDGPLPGACELLARLRSLGKPFYLVTNSAARLPEHAAQRYRCFGLAIEPEQIISSGGLLKPYFAGNGLQGSRCAILGPEDTFHFVSQAGGLAVPPSEDFDVLVIGDQVGFPFLESMDAVLSRLISKFDRGESPLLILPNPDLIYPKARGFGITCGAMALVIETVLKQRYPGRTDIRFVHLGKPETALFEEAARRACTRNLVMIGDQMDTDILGACRFGIDSALVSGGVAELAFHSRQQDRWPTYQLTGL